MLTTGGPLSTAADLSSSGNSPQRPLSLLSQSDGYSIEQRQQFGVGDQVTTLNTEIPLVFAGSGNNRSSSATASRQPQEDSASSPFAEESSLRQAGRLTIQQPASAMPSSSCVVPVDVVSPASSWVTETDFISTPIPTSSSPPCIPSSSRPRPLVDSNLAVNVNLTSRNTSQSHLQPLPPPHHHRPPMFSLFPSSSSHSQSTPSNSSDSTATTLSASHSSVDSHAYVLQSRRRTTNPTSTTTTVAPPAVVPSSPSCVQFANTTHHNNAVPVKVPSSTAASTSASVSSPPAGMGAAQPPQLERRTSEVTSFSSVSSDDATGADTSHDFAAAQLSPSGDNSNNTPRRPSITTSKSALELLTKGRITSNLAIYKPRELWKPDAHAEKCDSPHCSKSFLLPFASSLGSIPFPSLSSSLSSLSSFLSSSSSASSSPSSTHGSPSSYSSQASTTLIGSTSSASSSSSISATTQPITLLRNRHHCRMCGGVFCSECTTFQAALLDTRNMPWLFVPEGHDLLDVPVPGSSAAADVGVSGIGSTVVEGVRRASQGLVSGLRRRTSQIVTSSSTADSAVPPAGRGSEDLDSEDNAAADTFPPTSALCTTASSPIKRLKSSLAAVASSYAATTTPTSVYPSATTATAAPTPVPAYRTPQPHLASPSNPNPPTFSLPLYRASTSLAASALPESEPLVRVERICIGCAALLRGAAGKGRSAIPSLKSNASSSSGASGVAPSSPVTTTFGPGAGTTVSGMSRTSSFSSFVGLGGVSSVSGVPNGNTIADMGKSSFGSNEESERAREDIRAFRERLDSGMSVASAPPMITPNTSSSSLSTRRRRSHLRSAGSETTSPGAISGTAMAGEAVMTKSNMRWNSSLSSLATAPSAGVLRQSPPTPQHTFSPAVSSPLSPTPRSPRSSRFIISPSNAVHPPPPHGLDLGVVGVGVDSVVVGGANGTSGIVLPKRTQSVLLPPPSFLPAIPEPVDDIPPRQVGVAGMARKSAINAGVRPGMRRAHSSNEVDLPRAANAAASAKLGVSIGSPLARASSLCAAGHSNSKRQQQKGKHVAWLPSSGSSFSPSSPESAKPSPLRTVLSSSTTSTSLVVSPHSNVLGGAGAPTMESGLTSATVTGGTSTPTVRKIPSAPPIATAIPPSAAAKLKKDRCPSPTGTLYGRPRPGQISLREVLQQTLGSDSDEDDEGDITISQDNAAALIRSVSSVASSTSSRYSQEERFDNAYASASETMAVVPFGAAFPASPPVQRHDKPVLYAPFGNGAPPAPSLLTAATSRIITPSLPPSLMEPREPTLPTPAPTPPITRPPSAADLSKQVNKSRAEAYAAHARYEDDLAARRRLAVLPANQPFGFMAAAGIVGGVITGGTGAGVVAAYGNEKKLFGGAAGYGREIEDDIRVPAAPTQTRRDLVKPLYAMTLSTF